MQVADLGISKLGEMGFSPSVRFASEIVLQERRIDIALLWILAATASSVRFTSLHFS